ncbi:MAG: ABC transporter substrate-binding protein, partial [Monoglobaceae bacterium]
MKKLFKAVAAMLMSAMVAASLAGCGSSEGGEGKKLTEINIWTGDSHSKNTMKELVDKFNKERGEKLGVKVVYTVKEGNYNQTIDMAVASEQAPDMFTCFSTQKYAEGGTVIAIDDIKGGKEYLDSVLDEEAKDNFITTYDRKCYKVPFYVNTFGVIYNKDMFKAHGLVDENGEAKPPETYEEFVQYAKELTNTENSEYGIILPFKDSGTASYFINLTFASTGSKGYDPITGKYDYTV